MKTCKKCGERKPVEAFHRRAKSPDGLAYKCKECCASYRAEYYRSNSITLIKAASDWYSANANLVREIRRNRYWKDPARFRSYSKVFSSIARQELTDSYIRDRLAAQGIATTHAELINLKREQLRLRRLAHEMEQAAIEAKEKE